MSPKGRVGASNFEGRHSQKRRGPPNLVAHLADHSPRRVLEGVGASNVEGRHSQKRRGPPSL
eukprot:1561645-Ditylum_brightwellii.AAC.1